MMALIQASLARRGMRDGEFRGLKPTAKVMRRYCGEGPPSGGSDTVRGA